MHVITSFDVSAKEHICKEYVVGVLKENPARSHRGKELVNLLMDRFPAVLFPSVLYPLGSAKSNDAILFAAALAMVTEMALDEVVEILLKGEILDTLFKAIFDTEFVQAMINSAVTVPKVIHLDEDGNVIHPVFH